MNGRSLQGFREDISEIEVPETEEKDRKLLAVASIYGCMIFTEGTEDYETIIELVRRNTNEIT